MDKMTEYIIIKAADYAIGKGIDKGIEIGNRLIKIFTNNSKT